MRRPRGIDFTADGWDLSLAFACFWIVSLILVVRRERVVHLFMSPGSHSGNALSPAAKRV